VGHRRGGLVALLVLLTTLLALDATDLRRADGAAGEVAETPRCYGAASRDPSLPCVNPDLRVLVTPTPAQARKLLNSWCTRVERLACAFGVPAEEARRHVALLGDSHAAHWRAALDVVAERRGWHGLSVIRCAFTDHVRPMPEPKFSSCARWRPAVRRWFRRHPEVDTVFVSQITGHPNFEAQVQGFLDAWRRLPRTVKRIVVLRDTPKPGSTARCVERAMARRVDAGEACAVSRSAALAPDPAAEAARRLGRPRVRVVDLTSAFCGPRTCRPVVGGALVFKDDNHMTRDFARTLGPLVDRALRD
jgi:hypothetical protein